MSDLIVHLYQGAKWEEVVGSQPRAKVFSHPLTNQSDTAEATRLTGKLIAEEWFSLSVTMPHKPA